MQSDHGITCSMSRKGNCWDNACMESFFGSHKNEWLSEKKYKTREEAIKDVFEYVEMFIIGNGDMNRWDTLARPRLKYVMKKNRNR